MVMTCNIILFFSSSFSVVSAQWEGNNERPPFWVKRFLSPIRVKCGPGSVGKNLTNTATGTHMVLWEHAVCIKGNTHVFILGLF